MWSPFHPISQSLLNFKNNHLQAIIQKNINFLRRPSKKADFIIENIFEEGNIIDDKKIIELYFERNEQAIKETDIKYGKLCHKIAYNILNNLQDSEEYVNDTY